MYLWLVIFATTLFIGIITWILEDQTFQWRKNKDRCITNVKEMIWQAFSGLFFASEVRLQRFPARIVWLCFWFMILILTAAYNADLTTKMSTNTFACKLKPSFRFTNRQPYSKIQFSKRCWQDRSEDRHTTALRETYFGI